MSENSFLNKMKGVAHSVLSNISGRKAQSSGPREWNNLIDRSINSLLLDEQPEICMSGVVDYTQSEYWQWLKQTVLPFTSLSYPHKKALEFFFSCKLLDVNSLDHILDAAGGRAGYLIALKRAIGCSNLYLTDHIYSNTHRDTDGITIVGGDIRDINLPNCSLTKISCHHAFEHFQADRDIKFIQEIGRLLKPGGRACIIPLFLVNQYTECWNIEHVGVFDEAAQLIVDKTASIPGADDDGHFARFYGLEAFQRRILDTAEEVHLLSKVVACRLDGKDLPDMDRNFGSKLNYPLRALILDKFQ